MVWYGMVWYVCMYGNNYIETYMLCISYINVYIYMIYIYNLIYMNMFILYWYSHIVFVDICAIFLPYRHCSWSFTAEAMEESADELAEGASNFLVFWWLLYNLYLTFWFKYVQIWSKRPLISGYFRCRLRLKFCFWSQGKCRLVIHSK